MKDWGLIKGKQHPPHLVVGWRTPQAYDYVR